MPPARSDGRCTSATSTRRRSCARERKSIPPGTALGTRTFSCFSRRDAPKGGYDLIAIGTPPESHVPLALQAIEERPRAVLVEKPFCPPDLAGVEGAPGARRNRERSRVRRLRPRGRKGERGICRARLERRISSRRYARCRIPRGPGEQFSPPIHGSADRKTVTSVTGIAAAARSANIHMRSTCGSISPAG